MIAVAIVSMTAHFESPAGISWVISALYIATAVAAPMGGQLGTLFGARRIYLIGLALVGAGSIVGALAPNVGALAAGYILLGSGMATHFPNATTMVRAYAERHAMQPRSALTTLVLCSQVVAAMGPTLGGLLVGAFGWQSILWVNLPVVALSALAIIRFADIGFVGGTSATGRELVRSLDIPGIAVFLVLMSTTMLFLLSLSDAPRWWLAPIVVFAAALFMRHERRIDEPFIDVRALGANRALSATLVRTLLTYTTFYCVFFGIPQWLQYTRGMDATTAGLTMLPVAVVAICSTISASWVYRRYGSRPTLVIGTLALLVGGVLLAVVERSTAPILVLLLVAAVLGIPQGFNNIGNQNVINSVTTVAEVGTAIGTYRTVQYIGANLSTVVLQITAGSVIDDVGMRRLGWFIVVCAAVLLTEATLTPSMRIRAAPKD